MPHQPAQMSAHLDAGWRLAGPQDGDDMDRQETGSS
jgi:hypothetical protein